MPRLPILSREGFYTRLPNNGGLRMLDFNLVNTSLGAMIEMVPMCAIDQKMAAVDVYDESYDRISEINGDQFYSLFNTSGPGVFQSYAR